ncbi:MAG: hypothetical protein M1814_001374 [Vezdaea aestivalis]|nr:MAG: hypothetical protein M1814_001374 [Vezdaea aestivalis]
MFSARNSFAEPPVSSLRNPRRRQRTHSGETALPVPEAKRRRSALTPDLFKPPRESGSPSDKSGKLNGSALKPEPPAGNKFRLTVRDSKKTIDRGIKGDASTLLTRNDYHAVNLLPALPDVLRKDPQGALSGEIYPNAEAGLCLGLVPTGAVIWQYCSPASSPETFTFDISSFARVSEDHLPLGSLVYSSSSSEIGLVLVAPANGKIMYWESITAAASLDARQQQKHCIEGSVGGFFSGDTVVQIVKAEPAGFVLRFRSGKLAQLSIRDEQGRAAVIVQFMKSNTPGRAASGLFGSIRSALGTGNWRRDVVAVKAGRTSKQLDRQVIVATEGGIFQVWEINRNGYHFLRTEIATEDAILGATDGDDGTQEGQRRQSFKILDFVILPDIQSQTQDDNLSVGVVALAAFVDHEHSSYQLIDFSIDDSQTNIHGVHPIRSYQTSPNHYVTQRPTLILPRPGRVAFVVFDRAVVVASVHRQSNTAEDQLLRESHAPVSYEEVVDFRPGTIAQIVGAGSEDASEATDTSKSVRRKAKDPSCTILIQGYGVIRITSFSLPSTSLVDGQAAVKSKIEQAILYGSAESILNFAGRVEVQYSLHDVERAASQVSQEILNSKSRVVASASPSMASNLSMKATALKSLALYLKNTFPPLSRNVKWNLLWDAEKLAAARTVWKKYDESLEFHKPDEENQLGELAWLKRTSGVGFIIEYIPTEVSTPMDPKKGDDDPVRHWFTHDISQLPLVAAMAYQTLLGLHQQFKIAEPELSRAVSELNDVCLSIVETAFKFRQDNSLVYGLGSQATINAEQYVGIPLPWTSFQFGQNNGEGKPMSILQTLESLNGISLDLTDPKTKSLPARAKQSLYLADKVRSDTLRLTDAYLVVGLETQQWQEAQAAGSEQDQVFTKHFYKTRETLLHQQYTIMPEESIQMARKYMILSVLAELQYNKLRKLEKIADQTGNPEHVAQYEAQRRALIEDLDKSDFGQVWADHFFLTLIQHNKSHIILDDFRSHIDYVTDFLQSGPEFTKLSWINDILNRGDYGSAGKALIQYQKTNETQLSTQRMELSLGKLSLLADAEVIWEGDNPSNRPIIQEAAATFERARCQTFLRELLLPIAEDAVDVDAAVSLLIETMVKSAVKGKPMFKASVERGFAGILSDEIVTDLQLVDAYTFVRPPIEAHLSDGKEEGWLYLQALKIIANSSEDSPLDKTTLEKMVWRRCMLRSDWIKLNKTESKDDRAVEEVFGHTLLFKLLRAGFEEGKSKPYFWAPQALHGSPWRPIDVVDAGCSADKLGNVLPQHTREALAKDFSLESATLAKQLEQGRLDFWYDGIVETAKKLDADEKAEVRAQNAIKRYIGRGMRLNPPNYPGDEDELLAGEVEGEALLAPELVRTT